MKTIAVLLLLFILVGCSSQEAQNAGNEEQSEWIVLFDGKTFDGWRGYNQDEFPARGWEVRDGTLMTVPSDDADRDLRGDILTEQRFENFELSIEFKVSPGGNSGVDSDRPYAAAPESRWWPTCACWRARMPNWRSPNDH